MLVLGLGFLRPKSKSFGIGLDTSSSWHWLSPWNPSPWLRDLCPWHWPWP